YFKISSILLIQPHKFLILPFRCVNEFCNENDIRLHFIPKGSLWLQAFIERGFRTIKEEFLNLIWIGDMNKFKDVLQDARYGYNHRPNSAFVYRNPLEVMATRMSNLPQVGGH
ncbi:MAG TPA: integrase core domain-containing protein, partial [Candidatus Methanoperedens sp.]